MNLALLELQRQANKFQLDHSNLLLVENGLVLLSVAGKVSKMFLNLLIKQQLENGQSKNMLHMNSTDLIKSINQLMFFMVETALEQLLKFHLLQKLRKIKLKLQAQLL